jgi:hypothetical protein
MCCMKKGVGSTSRRRIIAPADPKGAGTDKRVPDFLARLRAIYGEKVLEVSPSCSPMIGNGCFPSSDSSTNT